MQSHHKAFYDFEGEWKVCIDRDTFCLLCRQHAASELPWASLVLLIKIPTKYIQDFDNNITKSDVFKVYQQLL